MSDLPVVHHIPVCPFSQRLEILLSLKQRTGDIRFSKVDITKPRDPALLEKTRGTTALPVLELPDGRILKESLVILGYLDETIGTPVRRSDPYEHAVERQLIAQEGPFTGAGYTYVLNQDPTARADRESALLKQYRALNDFLAHHNPEGPFLFDTFGLAEAVFTPMFMRFWFLEYYEDFALPDTPEYARVRRWVDACLSHAASQQVSREEIVKLYYDYAIGAGNGALAAGREVSSFAFNPPWQERPWPPRDKYSGTVSDAELGLLPN